jgi:5-(carboxyamino)imidazole ribonucleotide synthase
MSQSSAAQTSATSFPPGSVLGVLGNGQLGRMFAIAAAQLGYRVWCFGPEANSPAAQVCERDIVAEYTDTNALREFASGIVAATIEFENIPAAAVDLVGEYVPVRPASQPLHIAQHRRREKEFLAAHQIPCAPFRIVTNREELTTAIQDIGYPAILKTAGFGYDGKGQTRIYSPADLDLAWDSQPITERVLEGWVSFTREISVLVARTHTGESTTWPVFENQHVAGILDLTICPARIPNELAKAARHLALRVAEALNVVGLLCVEMFVTQDGQLVVNELAPRPHNSGHLTIEAHHTSQFEQQARITAGLPLGSTAQREAAAMVNLLGDVWELQEPDWRGALALPGVSLHLYGKKEPRPGRKMGHVTAVAATPDAAAELAVHARSTMHG